MQTRQLLGASWQRGLVGGMMGLLLLLLLMGGGAAAAHAQGSSSRVVVQQTITSAHHSRNAAPTGAPTPFSILQECLGSTLSGSSNSPGLWSVSGKAINSCPVTMNFANLHILLQENCPLGNNLLTDDIQMAPKPTWPSGTSITWGVNGGADCFVCTNGFMTVVPPYSETVSVNLRGTGTNGGSYMSAQPDDSVTFAMQQFPFKTPCF